MQLLISGSCWKALAIYTLSHVCVCGHATAKGLSITSHTLILF